MSIYKSVIIQIIENWYTYRNKNSRETLKLLLHGLAERVQFLPFASENAMQPIYRFVAAN